MKQQINLFNVQFVEQKAQFLTGTLLKCLGIVVACCSAYSVYLNYRVHTLTKLALTAEAKLTTSGNELKQIQQQSAPKEKNRTLEVQIQQTEQEIQSLKKVVSILKAGDIGNAEGYSGYMQAFARQSIDGIWLTGFEIDGAGKNIELTGRAVKPTLLPQYINRLKNEPVMQGKFFGNLEMQLPETKPATSGKEETAIKTDFIEFKLN